MEDTQLREEITQLTEVVVSLRKAVVGQTAMIAALTGVLTKQGVVTQEEALVIATAGMDAQSFDGLTVEQVQRWIIEQIKRSPSLSPGSSTASLDPARPSPRRPGTARSGRADSSPERPSPTAPNTST